ncbi:McrB family protein [Sphingomonas sp. BK345]|uniref:McrB family protein n=1 Tax=Sphingomonas sp. BK345 TaxID=2586980 RepID=UPI00160BD7F6|nr:hypothetical protein [Sphingomonas sp. BK345]MBB3472744.1 MoxR-like ATPase [Sphingomonas sp. BK345]
MSFRERADTFSTAVAKQFGVLNKAVRASFGVSNSAKIIEGGIQLGVLNLENFSQGNGQLVLASILRFPPEDEVWFAIQVKGDLLPLVERLEAMKALGLAGKAQAAGEADPADAANVPNGTAADTQASEGAGPSPQASPGDITYGARNNLVAIYLAHDGRLYLRNRQFWDTLRFDLARVGPGIEIDSIAVALWPPAASARRSLLAREFVGYLASLVGAGKVHELAAWTDEEQVAASMRRLPSTVPLVEIETAIAEQGGHYPASEVGRFHAGLSFLERKHFVILAGLSGTGKTQLALQYARAVHGTASGSPDPFLFVCAVRPEWTDPGSLLGYFDVLSGRYEVPRFLEAVLVATAHRDSPVFVVLDELNLARVEYYLSDILSAMETGEPMQLHQSGVPLEGTTGTPVRRDLPLPPNLFLIGTINIDETTNPLSAKVLDRAVVIDMSAVDLKGFLDALAGRDEALAPAIGTMRAKLEALEAILAPEGLGFGYRVAEEAVRYYAFATASAGASPEGALDDILAQKVLVKLRGGERQRSMLAGLAKETAGLPRSGKMVAQALADLDDLGSFQVGR